MPNSLLDIREAPQHRDALTRPQRTPRNARAREAAAHIITVGRGIGRSVGGHGRFCADTTPPP